MIKTFSEKLLELRGDLSQLEFARKIGVKQSSYNYWERGIKEPSYSIIKPICEACKCSPSWLLGMEETTKEITKTIDLNHKLDLLKQNAIETTSCVERLLSTIKKVEDAL